jgi:hypothetical protein
MSLDKSKLYDELKKVYLSDNDCHDNTSSDIIIRDLCNFFDSNTLNYFLEFIKKERDI